MNTSTMKETSPPGGREFESKLGPNFRMEWSDTVSNSKPYESEYQSLESILEKSSPHLVRA